MSRQYIPRWNVALVGTLALVTLGLLYANVTLLAGTVIPLAYVLYGTLSRLPEDPALHVERNIEPATPGVGEEVTVTLTIENDGESVLSDVRLIDGVPQELSVETRAPGLCVSLSPGETQIARYTVVARRGTYPFDRPTVRLRSLAGVDVLTDTLDVSGDELLTCVSAVETGPRQTQTTQHAGAVTTDRSGSGLEFHSTREYTQGDPVSSIDWHHVAKTGEFITVQYREENNSEAVVLLDARPVNRVTPRTGQPTAVDRCVHAGERLYDVMRNSGTQTSVGAVGLDGEADDDERFERVLGSGGLVWMGPGQRAARQLAVFEAVARAPPRPEHQPLCKPPKVSDGPSQPRVGDGPSQSRGADDSSQPRVDGDTSHTGVESVGDGGSRTNSDDTGRVTEARTDGGDQLEQVFARLPPRAQVFLCSPLLDHWPVEFGRALAASEHDLVVVSPDPVGADTPGQRLTGVHRQLRLRELERTGATTADWPLGEPFETTLRKNVPTRFTHR